MFQLAFFCSLEKVMEQYACFETKCSSRTESSIKDLNLKLNNLLQNDILKM